MDSANLHAALRWLRETGDVSRLLALAGDLVYFWELRGHLREGRQWLEWGLAQKREIAPAARASAQLALAGILETQRESAPALALCEEFASITGHRVTPRESPMRPSTPQRLRPVSVERS